MRERTNRNSLTTKMNNRVEVWGKKIIDTDLGEDYEDSFIKKMWCDIIPIGGSKKNASGETEYNDTTFKIRARKQELRSDNWLIYRELRYDIKYILPDFNTNKFIEIYAELNTE